jgi:hypothetical protein
MLIYIYLFLAIVGVCCGAQNHPRKGAENHQAGFLTTYLTMCPPVISWFINPIKYNLTISIYEYHKNGSVVHQLCYLGAHRFVGDYTHIYIYTYVSGWWLQTCFICHNIWDNPSH